MTISKTEPTIKQIEGREKKKIANQNIIIQKINDICKDTDYSYDYSNALNVRSKIQGYCKRHNTTFTQLVQTTLLNNHNCKDCNSENKEKYSLDDWKNKVQEKNNNTISFEKFTPTTSREKGILICKECNTEYFKNLYLSKTLFVCKPCSKKWHIKKNTICSFEEFIDTANKKYNNAFIYNKNSWKSYYEPMEIIYKDTIYLIKPISHIHSIFGCIYPYEIDCTKQSKKLECIELLKPFTDKGYQFTFIQAINDSVHKKDYKVEGVCPKNHTTTKTMIAWTKFKDGCSICSKQKYIRTIEETELLLKAKYPNYKFALTNYRVAKDKILGICDKGDRSVKTYLDWIKYPCTKCNISFQSRFELDIIAKIKLLYPNINILERFKLDGQEIDIYFPDYKFGIEAHGIFWHSTASNQKTKTNLKISKHKDKYIHCDNLGVRLIQVFENEWFLMEDKILKLISTILSPRIDKLCYARNTICKQIPNKDANHFYEAHHLQGKTKAMMSYGLFKQDLLIASMSFARGNAIRQGRDWELCRFAHSEKIVGGASKLLSHFIKNNQETNYKIISFADNRWFTGGVYPKLGFIEESQAKPDYKYTTCKITDKFISKNKMQRKNIPAMLIQRNIQDSFNPLTDTRTEYEMADICKMYRVYDAGKIKFVKNIT